MRERVVCIGMVVLLVLSAMLAPVDGMAQTPKGIRPGPVIPTMNTIGGLLAITLEEDGKNHVRLKKKDLLSAYESTLVFERKFINAGNDVVLLSKTKRKPGSPATFNLITVKRDGSPSVSDEFGQGTPSIMLTATRIFFTFRSSGAGGASGRNGPAPPVYVYENGKLTKTGQ